MPLWHVDENFTFLCKSVNPNILCCCVCKLLIYFISFVIPDNQQFTVVLCEPFTCSQLYRNHYEELLKSALNLGYIIKSLVIIFGLMNIKPKVYWNCLSRMDGT
jgi:hypothetical protein